MTKANTRLDRLLLRAGELRAAWRDYFTGLGRREHEPVADRAGLQRFLQTRSSYVAQTSLYGYLRTRSGMLYPQLFDNDEYLRSINVAKWHVWLACLSDLSVYTGGLLARQAMPVAEVHNTMQTLVTGILQEAGQPAEAGVEYAAHAARVQQRLAHCDWLAVPDDETAFSESPQALVHWAPVIDELKALDDEIVRNSVRFRWQEARRALRRNLDVAALSADAK